MGSKKWNVKNWLKIKKKNKENKELIKRIIVSTSDIQKQFIKFDLELVPMTNHLFKLQ